MSNADIRMCTTNDKRIDFGPIKVLVGETDWMVVEQNERHP